MADTLPPLPELPAPFGMIAIEKATRTIYLQGYTPYQVRKLLREYGAQCAAAERERRAKLLDTLTMVHDWAAIAADMGDVLGQRIQTACAEALGPNDRGMPPEGSA